MIVELNAFGCTRLLDVEPTILNTGFRLPYIDKEDKQVMFKHSVEHNPYFKGSHVVFEYNGSRNYNGLPILYFDRIEK